MLLPGNDSTGKQRELTLVLSLLSFPPESDCWHQAKLKTTCYQPPRKGFCLSVSLLSPHSHCLHSVPLQMGATSALASFSFIPTATDCQSVQEEEDRLGLQPEVGAQRSPPPKFLVPTYFIASQLSALRAKKNRPEIS